MLCGVFDLSGGPAAELTSARTIRARFPSAETISHGPLLIAHRDAALAEADRVHCVFEGRLHGVADPVTPHDRAVAGADAVARAGRGGLTGVRGSYSAVIWEDGSDRCLLACDLLATRQWFIWPGAGYALFATELRDLLAIMPARPAPDPTGFLMWLAEGACPLGVTLYEGVSRLGPGRLVELSPAGVEERTYWSPSYTGTLAGPRGDLAAALRERLGHATAGRLSGSSNGVVFSGGLDSSIVAAFADRYRGRDARLRTYSAVFPGAEYDESEKIAAMVSALRLDSALFRVEPQGTLALAIEHTLRWELPLIGAGAVVDATMAVEAARDGIDVLLDGQTGDEVLGFAPYLVADRLRQGRFLAALELTRRWPLGRPTTTREKLWIVRNLGAKKAAPTRLAEWSGRRKLGSRGPAWLLPSARRRFDELELAHRWDWKTQRSGPLWWRHLVDATVNTPHRDLRLDSLRHRAAAVGLVNESPLYDVDLIEFCLQLPPELAFDRRFGRPLARESMAGLIPDSVRLQTQKANFSPFCADGDPRRRRAWDRAPPAGRRCRDRCLRRHGLRGDALALRAAGRGKAVDELGHRDLAARGGRMLAAARARQVCDRRSRLFRRRAQAVGRGDISVDRHLFQPGRRSGSELACKAWIPLIAPKTAPWSTSSRTVTDYGSLAELTQAGHSFNSDVMARHSQHRVLDLAPRARSKSRRGGETSPRRWRAVDGRPPPPRREPRSRGPAGRR